MPRLRIDERRRSISERLEIESRNEGWGDEEMSARNAPRKSGARSSGSRKDETANQALERAMGHASVALSEGVASARALLDAASLIVSELPAEAQPNLAELARALDQVSEALSGNSPSLRATATHALLETIDSEIARWEVKSRSDDDARSVLRVFMSLREAVGDRHSSRSPWCARSTRGKGPDRLDEQGPQACNVKPRRFSYTYTHNNSYNNSHNYTHNYACAKTTGETNCRPG
jgi:hypothetical protein